VRHTPEHLGDHGSKFWKEFLGEFEPESASEYALLERVCSLIDRVKAAEAAIKQHGEYVASGDKITSNPALRHLHQFTGLYLKALKELQVKTRPGPAKRTLKNTRKGGKI